RDAGGGGQGIADEHHEGSGDEGGGRVAERAAGGAEPPFGHQQVRPRGQGSDRGDQGYHPHERVGGDRPGTGDGGTGGHGDQGRPTGPGGLQVPDAERHAEALGHRQGHPDADDDPDGDRKSVV